MAYWEDELDAAMNLGYWPEDADDVQAGLLMEQPDVVAELSVKSEHYREYKYVNGVRKRVK